MQHTVAIRADQSEIRDARSRCAIEARNRCRVVCFYEPDPKSTIRFSEVKAANLAFELACFGQPLCLCFFHYRAIALQVAMLPIALPSFRKGRLLVLIGDKRLRCSSTASCWSIAEPALAIHLGDAETMRRVLSVPAAREVTEMT